MYQGLNVVGMRRRNFSPESIASIEKAYQIIYHQNLNVSQALQKIRDEVTVTDEVNRIVDFIQRSKRGIIGFRT
jgi:UDP-N-acetylglucosamine acyltransferase